MKLACSRLPENQKAIYAGRQVVNTVTLICYIITHLLRDRHVYGPISRIDHRHVDSLCYLGSVARWHVVVVLHRNVWNNDSTKAEQQRKAAGWSQDRMLHPHYSSDCSKSHVPYFCTYFIVTWTHGDGWSWSVASYVEAIICVSFHVLRYRNIILVDHHRHHLYLLIQKCMCFKQAGQQGYP